MRANCLRARVRADDQHVAQVVAVHPHRGEKHSHQQAATGSNSHSIRPRTPRGSRRDHVAPGKPRAATASTTTATEAALRTSTISCFRSPSRLDPYRPHTRENEMPEVQKTQHQENVQHLDPHREIRRRRNWRRSDAKPGSSCHIGKAKYPEINQHERLDKELAAKVCQGRITSMQFNESRNRLAWGCFFLANLGGVPQPAAGVRVERLSGFRLLQLARA